MTAICTGSAIRWWARAFVCRADGTRPRVTCRCTRPDPAKPGSSVSHWDTALLPNELMEPSYTGPNHDVGLARELFNDLGWQTIPTTTTVSRVARPRLRRPPRPFPQAPRRRRPRREAQAPRRPTDYCAGSDDHHAAVANYDRARPDDDHRGAADHDKLVVGRVAKSHGVRGELVIEVRTDEPDLRFSRLDPDRAAAAVGGDHHLHRRIGAPALRAVAAASRRHRRPQRRRRAARHAVRRRLGDAAPLRGPRRVLRP